MLIRESGLDCPFLVSVAILVILVATVGVPLGQAQFRPICRANERQETRGAGYELLKCLRFRGPLGPAPPHTNQSAEL